MLQAQDPEYYASLMRKLSPEQHKDLQEILVTADQKRAQYNSKLIQKQGGNTSVLAQVSQFTLT